MAVSPAVNVCNLSRIYNENYQYPLPRKVLESCLEGTSSESECPYTQKEFADLVSDINDLYDGIVFSNPMEKRLVVMSVGSIGSGKTLAMRKDLEEKTDEDTNYAYVHLEDVCLRNMFKTYQKDLRLQEASLYASKASYDKWKSAAYAATHIVLANLILEGRSIYLDTSITNPPTPMLCEFFKSQGYAIRVICVVAPTNVRVEAVRRKDNFIQATQDEVIKDGTLLPLRVNNLVIKYAKTADFYYRNQVEGDAKLVAVWNRNLEGSEGIGALKITDSSDYHEMVATHNAAAKILVGGDFSWEAAVY